MPAPLLVDLSSIDVSKAAYTIDDIRKFNPQRHEMEQLSYIAELDLEKGYTVAVKDVKPQEFWCRSHIPGRPLFPGVLRVQAAAQASGFHYHMAKPDDERFFGFGGIDSVKFRGEVKPGDTLVILAKVVEMRKRRAIFDTQALVSEKLVFQGKIIGMPM